MGKHWKTLLLAGIATLLSPASAGAFPPMPNGFKAGLAWDHLVRRDGGPCDGFGVLLGYRRSLADDWDVFANVAWSGLPARSGPASDLLSAGAGVALVLDASAFRPEVFAGIGFLGSVASHDLPADGMAFVGLALEWRPVRPVAVALRAEYRLPFVHRDRVSSATSIALHAIVPF